MYFEKSTRGDITIVALIGDLDTITAAQVDAALDNLAPEGGRLLLDLGRVTYRTSLGLRMLLLVYRRARQLSLHWGLAGTPPVLRDLLSTTGFLRGLVVAENLDAGLEALA